jgi:hypothetical protein
MDTNEKIGHAHDAFEKFRVELTPQAMRDILSKMDEVQGIEQLSSYMSLARNVMANDRTALLAAVILTSTGVRPLPVETEEVL